jgi:hypothetical protein
MISHTIMGGKVFVYKRDTCRDLALRHIRTRPYTPKTNAKAERFIQTALRERACAQACPTSNHRAAELPFWLHRYNWHRPHGGIKSQTPISRLDLSEDNLLRLHSQRYPARLLIVEKLLDPQHGRLYGVNTSETLAPRRIRRSSTPQS